MRRCLVKDMELNGFHCDGEGCAEEQEGEPTALRIPRLKAETSCSTIATPGADSAEAGGSALREQRMSKSTPAMLRLDSLKKNRPRR